MEEKEVTEMRNCSSKRNWMEIEDDADIVTFYEWAVMMAERECE